MTYGTLKRRLTPTLRDNQALYADAVDEAVTPGTVWLDAGCGHQVFANDPAREAVIVGRAKLVIGCDLDHSSLTRHATIHRGVVCDLEHIPLPDESVSLVTCNVTVEHLADPSSVFREFFRLLVPGGRLLIHTPNAWSHFVIAARLLPPPLRRRVARLLDGRALHDVYPTFYRANTAAQISRRLRAVGFQSVSCWTVAGDATVKSWPVLTALELLWIRATLTRWGRRFRVSMIASALK